MFYRMCDSCELASPFDVEDLGALKCYECGSTDLRRLTGPECDEVFQFSGDLLDYCDSRDEDDEESPSFESTQREYHGVADPDNPGYDDD